MLDFCPYTGHSEVLGNVTCHACLKAEFDFQHFNDHNVTSSPSDNYINYTSIVFCNSKLNPLGLGFCLSWLAMLFVTLATTADEFFCPSLEVIAKTLMFSQNVAGVTLLAFGNGAPEIFASFAGANKQRSELVISYLIGSGIFLTCIVAGTIVIVAPFQMVELPFLRDVIFYLIATFWTFWVLWKEMVTFYYALGFILIYLTYLTVVLVAHQVHRRWIKNHPQVVIESDTAPDPECRERTISSRTRSFQLTGDEITPWGGPPFVRRCWSSDDFEQRLLASDIQPITEASYETDNDSVPPSISCEYCYEERKNGIPFTKIPLRYAIYHWYALMIYTFFRELCPIDFLTWSKRSPCGKFFQILKIPINIILKLTIPVVTRWCRPLNALHCATSPIFFLFAIGYGQYVIEDVVPLWSVITGIGFLLMIAVFATSEWDKPPKYHMTFAVIGFVSSVTWVYIVANEIVGLLIALGAVFKISDSILGLTVLAWGNSINDVVSDITIAREGYPEMGISACFGGPLFNLLMGLGISFTTAVLHTENKMISIIFERTTKILLGFLFASLISSLIIVPCVRFQLKRWYGIYLYCLYSIFLIVIVINEVGLLSGF